MFAIPLALGLLAGSCTSRPSSNGTRGGSAPPGSNWSEFKLPDFQGKPNNSADWKEPVLVLHFWASWCTPCLEELPEFVRFAARYGSDSRVRFVAVNLDSSTTDALAVLQSDGLPKNLLSLWDEKKMLPERLGSYQFPETYLVSSERRVLHKWVGAQDWAQVNLNNWLPAVNSK